MQRGAGEVVVVEEDGGEPAGDGAADQLDVLAAASKLVEGVAHLGGEEGEGLINNWEGGGCVRDMSGGSRGGCANALLRVCLGACERSRGGVVRGGVSVHTMHAV